MVQSHVAGALVSKQSTYSNEGGDLLISEVLLLLNALCRRWVEYYGMFAMSLRLGLRFQMGCESLDYSSPNHIRPGFSRFPLKTNLTELLK